MSVEHIIARDLPEAWFLCIDACYQNGYLQKIDKGSFAKEQTRKQLEFVVVEVEYPWIEPLLPDIPPGYGITPPVDAKFLENYYTQILTAVKTQNQDYTYGERIFEPKIRISEDDGLYSIISKIKHPRIIHEKDKNNKNVIAISFPETNQYERIINNYAEHGFGSNQEIIQIGMPFDINIEDPPCLRHIDTKIVDGKLNYYPYFRSWDLWNGFPANLAAIEKLKQDMVSFINGFLGKEAVQNGKIIASSAGLHLYDYCWEYARIRLGKKE